MIKIKAYIKLYEGEGKRKAPFISGYRPLFKFIEKSMTSGSIELIDRDQFSPGEEGEVYIHFIFSELLGTDFGVNAPFLFGEGASTLGEGYVLEIVEGFELL